MSESGKRGRWVRAILSGSVAGLIPVPLVLSATLVWAELSGTNAQAVLPMMGLVFGLGGGASLALGAGWWASRNAAGAPIAHGIVAGAAAAVAGVVVVVLVGGSVTAPILIAWLVRPPAGAIGGWLAGRSRESPGRASWSG